MSNNSHSIVGKDLPYDMTGSLAVGVNILKIHQIGCACVSCKKIHWTISRDNIDDQKIQSYYFSIQIHQRHSENSLSRIVENSTISIQSSNSLIDDLLGNNSGEDEELQIIQESVKVSLKCPITMKRMKLPVRGKHCRHVDVSSV
jgi:hypothetical protein